MGSLDVSKVDCNARKYMNRMPTALDNFPCRKIELLEHQAEDLSQLHIIKMHIWNLIQDKKTFSSVKMQYCLQYWAQQQQWNVQGFLVEHVKSSNTTNHQTSKCRKFSRKYCRGHSCNLKDGLAEPWKYVVRFLSKGTDRLENN